MKKQIDVRIPPKFINNEKFIFREIQKKIEKNTKFEYKLVKKSIDARKKPVFLLRFDIFINEKMPKEQNFSSSYKNVKQKNEVHIIGAGPAGYFAALEFLEHGIRPIIFERGKDVQTRRKNLRAIQQFGIVDIDSNYCFGEGGAGTYSDGKLYTRSTKRGNVQKALKILIEHGASEDILIDAHPHIGSNKLPKIIQNMRETIERFGGEVHFESKITDFSVKNNKIESLRINSSEEIAVQKVILATGHSARDIYDLFRRKNIKMEFKPFAMGVRVEHPQKLIDEIQYRQNLRHENLPAASYKLVTQAKKRGVFSFCMCPGGIIVPAATEPEETVVNGMSQSRRDSKFANSGIVVTIYPEDLQGFEKYGELAGLEFQKSLEKENFLQGGDESQKAPSQRLTDFLRNKHSQNLPESSYIPGLESSNLHEWLPKSIRERLQIGFKDFDRKMKGFVTNEAQIVGVESRSSSPIRIPRNDETLEHIEISGLYPCGEGAGYAGGIISAAMDGQRVAQIISKEKTR
jgi:uncharacterized FAD-dependent dehydrogenase